MTDEEREHIRIEEAARRAEAERRERDAQKQLEKRSRDDAAKGILGGRDKRDRDDDDE